MDAAEGPNEGPKFTQIPNEMIEALMRSRLPAEQRACLDVIFRKTYGWHKEQDWISHSQFSELTGINRKHVPRAIKGLIDRKIISVPWRDGKKHPTYRINKKVSQWIIGKKVSPGEVSKEAKHSDNKEDNAISNADYAPENDVRVSPGEVSGVSPGQGHTKESITKEKKQQQQETAAADFSFSDSKPKPTGHLTDDQVEYIRLTIEQKKANGEKPKKGETWGPLRGYLKKEILSGKDITVDLSELREWEKKRLNQEKTKEQRKLLSKHARAIEDLKHPSCTSHDERKDYLAKVVQDTNNHGAAVADVGGKEIKFTANELKHAFNHPQIAWLLDDIIEANKVDRDHYLREKTLYNVTKWEADKVVNFMVEYMNYPDTHIRFGGDNEGVFIQASDILEAFKESHPDIYDDYAGGNNPVKTPTWF